MPVSFYWGGTKLRKVQRGSISNVVRLSLIFICLLLGHTLRAWQQEYIAQVIDRTNLRPVALASISVKGDINKQRANALGYFQIKARAGLDTLLIERTGYKTELIIVPESERFRVMLGRMPNKLETLVLDNYPLEVNVEDLGGKTSPTAQQDSISNNWKLFRYELGNYLTKDPAIKNIGDDFRVRVLFSVDKAGKLILDQPGDSTGRYSAVYQAFRSLKNIGPTEINNIPVDNHYEIILQRGKGTYEFADEGAVPPGGYTCFNDYINKNFRMDSVRLMEGKVYRISALVSFDEQGKPQSIILPENIYPAIEKEVKRIFMNGPWWSPALLEGVPVPVRQHLLFKLEKHNLFKGFMPDGLPGLLGQYIRYPHGAYLKGTSGRTLVSFRVEKETRKLSEIMVLEDIGDGCGQEVKRALESITLNQTEGLSQGTVYLAPVFFGRRKDDFTTDVLKATEGTLLPPIEVLLSKDGVPFTVVPESEIKPYNSLISALHFDPRMIELELKGKNITRITPLIANFRRLEKLDLSNNRIDRVPDALAELNKLSFLDLSGNNIEELPESLAKLKNIKHINLSQNNISELPSSMTALRGLKTLILKGNPMTPEYLSQLRRTLPLTVIIFD